MKTSVESHIGQDKILLLSLVISLFVLRATACFMVLQGQTARRYFKSLGLVTSEETKNAETITEGLKFTLFSFSERERRAIIIFVVVKATALLHQS